MFGIKIDEKAGTIKKGRAVEPLAGVTAYVESAGGIDRRLSVSRTAGGALLLGPLGAVLGGIAKKKTSNEQLFLIVEGPTFAWSEEIRLEKGMGASTINQDKQKKARKFAAKITSAGRKSAVAHAVPPTPQGPSTTEKFISAGKKFVAERAERKAESTADALTQQSPYAGWYPNPEGRVQWWDGYQWTEHYQEVTS